MYKNAIIYAYMKKIKIKDEYITLQQLLKITDIISSGCEAKNYLANHPVLLNTEPEHRRGKKLFAGDILEIGQEKYEICK